MNPSERKAYQKLSYVEQGDTLPREHGQHVVVVQGVALRRTRCTKPSWRSSRTRGASLDVAVGSSERS